MNNPIQMLFDEHEQIISVVETAQQTENVLNTDKEKYDKTLRELIRFFRIYADKFHHRKEEEILFPEMCKKSDLVEGGIVKEMLENHEDFRVIIGNIEKAINEKNYETSQKILLEYCELLLDHIAIENDELFQMAESLLDESELEKIYFRFQDSDAELGENTKMELIEKMETLKPHFF